MEALFWAVWKNLFSEGFTWDLNCKQCVQDFLNVNLCQYFTEKNHENQLRPEEMPLSCQQKDVFGDCGSKIVKLCSYLGKQQFSFLFLLFSPFSVLIAVCHNFPQFISMLIFLSVGNLFFYSLPKRKKNTPKSGQLFSFFEIFTAEFSHFFVTKKYFFVTKKWLNSAVKISKNEKSCPLFGVFFPRLGRE